LLNKLSWHDKTLELWIEMAWPSNGLTTLSRPGAQGGIPGAHRELSAAAAGFWKLCCRRPQTTDYASVIQLTDTLHDDVGLVRVTGDVFRSCSARQHQHRTEPQL
jgi:hypothetical protein